MSSFFYTQFNEGFNTKIEKGTTMEAIVAFVFVMVVVALTFASVFIMELDVPEYEIVVAEDGNVWLHNVWEGWYYLIKVEG